ncbi:rod shape-determining protein RodA [Paraflavisolibacter sp. H34]|uniref:rod shape-determining protein RodA n=1 Tax=Huijunlia imazamoxiresistens TaxID=3127457 RepID=UPI003019B056
MSRSKNTVSISKGIDGVLVGLYLLLVSIGIVAIFAVTYREGDPILASFLSFGPDYSKQFYFFIVSGLIGVFILLTDSKFFPATANVWYAVGIFLLLLVFPFHTDVHGTKSIIRMGGIQFQPAEFCKVCVCLALAKYLSRPDTDFTKTRSQLIAAAIALTPAILTILQSETGLALVYFSFFLVMYREGLPPMILVVGFSLGTLIVATIVIEPNVLAITLTVIAGLAAYLMRRQIKKRKSLLITIVLMWFVCVGIQRFAVPFIFKEVMQGYQVDRIYSLFGKDNPYSDHPVALDAASLKKKDAQDYNVKQSKIAIGSGGVTGKGLLSGTQTRYDFVPEQRTDFIFCTIGEGFGFLGTVTLLGIFLFLLFRIVMVAERQRSVFSRCYAYGVAAVFFFHITINVCMTIGLAPVIGIPLPFISYGGTALLTFTILLFILIRLDADRQMILR